MNLASCVQAKGRALLIGQRGTLYVAKGYAVYRSDDGGGTWTLDCQIPGRTWQASVAKLNLAARLLRYNVQALQVLADGTRLAVARDGIYRAAPGEADMSRTWSVERGSRPINLAADGRRVLFGEYGGAEMDKVGVRIYCSEDGGRHFEIAHEFGRGEVHHIHNVVTDPFADYYWVLAGDHGRTAGIGVLEKKDWAFKWVERGNQMVRTVSVLPRPDCLIYGSDTELEHNYIVRLDKQTGRHEKIHPMEGSSLYAADFDGLSLISTCVEPSAVNRSRQSCLLASTDGANWRAVHALVKDRWNALLFQLGLIVLPYVQTTAPSFGMFSGQALEGNHDRVSIFRVKDA